ncbi:hypothetical protein [Streptomyces sp. NBC_01262]|uniref:hypothetical protein n=1 Tax=Streptomyces sp. NBC_01262 TaxID=2903803 RepID=UPI002E310488|nr:hypothetical protein [Streptomyces sp. NBC_01262]
MGARLAAAVHLQHPTTHEPILLQPGEEPEPEVAALITNPEAWEDGILPGPAAAEDPPGEPVNDPQPQAQQQDAGATAEPEPEAATVPEPEPARAPTPRARGRKTAAAEDSDQQ